MLLFWLQLRYGTHGFDDEKIWSVNNANAIEAGIKIQNFGFGWFYRQQRIFQTSKLWTWGVYLNVEFWYFKLKDYCPIFFFERLDIILKKRDYGGRWWQIFFSIKGV